MALIKQARKSGPAMDPRSTYTGATYTPSTVDHFVAMDDRRLPWESIGRKVVGVKDRAKPMTAAQALKAVGLDFPIEMTALQLAGSDLTVPDAFATHYTDPDSGELIVMGYVSGRYAITQPVDGLNFLDEVIKSVDGANYSSVWTMREKRQLGITLEFPDHIVIDPQGADDRLALFGLGVNSFDGSTGFQFAVTTARLWCLNQLFPLLKSAQRGFTLKHTTGIHGKIADARKAIGVTYGYAEEFDRIANAMQAHKITTDGMAKLNAALFPIDKADKPLKADRQEQRREGVMDLFRESPTNANIRGTAWGAFNAAMEFADWGRAVRGTGDEAERNRAVGTMVGRTTPIMTRAWGMLTEGLDVKRPGSRRNRVPATV